MSITRIERIAAAFLGLEALFVVLLAVWEGLALAGGDTDSVSSSIALLVLTLVAAAAVGAFAAAVWRGGSWGRSGGIVVQLLVLSVAGGTLTGDGANPQVAALIAAPAIVGLVLLIGAARAAGPRTRREADLEPGTAAEPGSD
ncbi:histidine kinase [Microbacterium sp. 179-B 1A2 NHS]|uniref:histidine kinase n=1 Tax=Microbacterium sp. 179-B 1A2 NHS TaxID=3142383 RepID=UPI0039A13E3F